MSGWRDMLMARSAELLDAPGSGSGHIVMFYFEARRAYLFAVTYHDRDLVIAAAEVLARASWALIGLGEPFLTGQLGFTAARVRQVRRWAPASEEKLTAAVAAEAALGRPVHPSLLR